MADRDFALPVGHVTTGVSDIQVCMGRAFRQTVDINTNENSNYINGVEIWIDSEHREIYSIFNGLLKYIPSTAEISYNQLELSILDSTKTILNFLIRNDRGEYLGLREPIPQKVIFQNINEVETRDIIIDFLISIYNDSLTETNERRWHPSLRLRRDNIDLKQILDTASTNGNFQAVIEEIVNDFFSGEFVLRFNAGEVIGTASTGLTGVLQPANCTLQNPRHLIIVSKEYAGNFISTKYYIWFFLKNYHSNRRVLNLITSATLNATDQTFNHPFLTALGIDLDTEVLPRELIGVTLPGTTTNTNALLIPVQELSSYHGRTYNSGRTTYNSPIEWRITNDNDLNFENRRRAGVIDNAFSICGETFASNHNFCPTAGATYTAGMRNVWNTWGNIINAMCTRIQFPSELIAASIQIESANNERALALEPLQNFGQETTIRNHLIASGVNSNILDKYNLICPKKVVNGQNVYLNADRDEVPITDPLTQYPVRVGCYGLSVPNPWNGSALIKSELSQLTWDELLYIVDVIPSRMSPGLIQTLVSTAVLRFPLISSWFPNYTTLFNVNAYPPQGQNRNRSTFLWLLEGEHSLLISILYHKYNYITAGTKLDPILVAAAYNAGSIQQSRLNPYYVRFFGEEYPRFMARYYNAIQDLFATGQFNIGVETSQVRFWRTL